MKRIHLLLVAILLIFMSPILVMGDYTRFPVFDSLLYKGKPDLTQFGMRSIKVIYAQELWDANEKKDFPNTRKITEVAKSIKPNTLVCIDIEHWPLTGDALTVKESVAKYLQVAKLFKQYNNNIKIGFYGILPVRDYWRAINNNSIKLNRWHTDNSNLRSIADSIDIIFPSLYTFYSDRKGWQQYAVANLIEAKKYGKPVYAFLWPQYHESNFLLKGDSIPGDYWRLQLQTCYKYSDGIVLWGGWQHPWIENADWWQETIRFMKLTGVTK